MPTTIDTQAPEYEISANPTAEQYLAAIIKHGLVPSDTKCIPYLNEETVRRQLSEILKQEISLPRIPPTTGKGTFARLGYSAC